MLQIAFIEAKNFSEIYVTRKVNAYPQNGKPSKQHLTEQIRNGAVKDYQR